MEIIDAVKNFEWGMAWRATQKFLFAIGCIALAAWFANLSSPLWMMASAVWLAMIWYLFFLAERAWEKQRKKHQIKKRIASYRPRSEATEPEQPKTRKRFVYFDADKCEDVYTTEYMA